MRKKYINLFQTIFDGVGTVLFSSNLELNSIHKVVPYKYSTMRVMGYISFENLLKININSLEIMSRK